MDGVDTGMDCLKVGKSNTVSTIRKGLKVRERECVRVYVCLGRFILVQGITKGRL